MKRQWEYDMIFWDAVELNQTPTKTLIEGISWVRIYAQHQRAVIDFSGHPEDVPTNHKRMERVLL